MTHIQVISTIGICSVVCSTGLVAAPPQIDSLSEGTQTLSAPVSVFGADFGSDQDASSVLIDGIEAIVTQWSDEEIHTYVPETSSFGEVDLQVVTA